MAFRGKSWAQMDSITRISQLTGTRISAEERITAGNLWVVSFDQLLTLHPDYRSLRFLFILAAVTAVIAQFAILRSVLLGRAPASSPGRAARFAEIAWVVLPTLALIAVLIFTWTRLGPPVALAPITGITV